MVQGGMSCVKYLMFAFNFIFVIAGIILISIGAVVKSTGKEYTEFLDSKYVTAPVILIVVGCFIFLLAFLGCCGAVKENYCMVVTFGAFLFIIFVIELAGGIAAYVYRNQLETFLKNNMNETLMQQKPDAKILWDDTQKKLKCCGIDGFKDYEKFNLTIPLTCCPPSTETEKQIPCTEDKVYKKGCFKEIEARLQSKITLVGGIGIGIAVIELLGIIFAWCLASAIKKEYEGV